MTLDLVTSQRLVDPTPWEMERFRSAPKHEREDWHDVLDRASAYRWDDAVLRVVEREARREEHARRRWFMPAVGMCGGPRPNVFRAAFQKDIGGVAGVSDSWFDASYYAVDGVSGKMSDWVDYVDPTHTFNQATSALQTSIPSARAGFNGRTVALFGNTQYYTSTRSDWSFTHNGTGFGVYFVFEPSAATTMALLSTRTFGGAGNPGANLACSAANSVSFETANGSSISSSFGGGATVAGTPTWLSAYASSSASPQQAAYKKSALADSDTTVVYAPQTNAMRLAADTSASFKLSGFVRGFYAFRRVLPAAHRTIVQQWIQRETGIAP